MSDIPPTYEPAVVAQRLLPALAHATAQGYRFFPEWFEDFTAYAWARRPHMHRLTVPVEPAEGRGGWAKFRGGGTRLQGDGRKMYHVYRDILISMDVLSVVDPSDRSRRLSGRWSVNLPVPSGSHGHAEAWRIAREMLADADPVGPVPLDEVRRHVGRCKSHVRRDPRQRPEGRHAELEHSPRNRHLLEQLRAAVLLAPAKINPHCLVVSRWPDGDEHDSADVAVFETAVAAEPVAIAKCGLGNAGDREMQELVELADTLSEPVPRLLYFSLYEPEPGLLRAAEAAGAGIEVLHVLPRRSAPASPRNARSAQ